MAKKPRSARPKASQRPCVWIATVRVDAPVPDYEIRVKAATWSEANRIACDTTPLLTTSVIGVRRAPSRKAVR